MDTRKRIVAVIMAAAMAVTCLTGIFAIQNTDIKASNQKVGMYVTSAKYYKNKHKLVVKYNITDPEGSISFIVNRDYKAVYKSKKITGKLAKKGKHSVTFKNIKLKRPKQSLFLRYYNGSKKTGACGINWIESL